MADPDSEFDLSRVDVVTFDSYGTLVDTDSATRALADLVDDPAATARQWRRNALLYAVVAGYVDTYGTYADLHRDGLRVALRAEEIALDEGQLRGRHPLSRSTTPASRRSPSTVRACPSGSTPV